MEASRQVGPFELLEALGAGGMGEVFKTRDTRLNRGIDGRGPQRGCAARPAYARRGLGAQGPKPRLRRVGNAPHHPQAATNRKDCTP